MIGCPAPETFASPAPWLVPYAGIGLCVAREAGRQAELDAVSSVFRLLDQAAAGLEGTVASSAAPVLEAGRLRFVPADEAPAGEAYEAFVHRTARVPTRDNLHDFFNGLVWLRFPLAKQRLNALQAAAIESAGIGGTRGPLRDALTLFDENGAVLDAPPSIWSAMLARDWQRLFVAERAAWREARLLVFGHALLEKLQRPRKALTAHVLMAPPIEGMGSRSIAVDDEAIARALDPRHLAKKPFVPLPVLGVPGWWEPNESPAFYADPAVFRAARKGRPQD
ncbi:conserved hypothetical protein [Burkholderiales bacterium 8X]|nr:conserved hypothetical protein [Burkholderiales bacterium 8X]